MCNAINNNIFCVCPNRSIGQVPSQQSKRILNANTDRNLPYLVEMSCEPNKYPAANTYTPRHVIASEATHARSSYLMRLSQANQRFSSTTLSGFTNILWKKLLVLKVHELQKSPSI